MRLLTGLFYGMFFLFLSCGDTAIPSIDIIKDDEIGWSHKERCSILYTENNTVQEIPAKIKCRGGMSSKYYKHSFSLELKHKVDLGGLPKDDDWIINANYIDKTFMRHRISFELFRQMSAKNVSPQSAYLNLNINGKYEGLYVLMQKMNAAMIGLDKSDSLSVLFKDPPIFYKNKLEHVQDSSNYYQQKFPKINEHDKTAYIEKFKSFLFASSDETFVKEIATWVDIDNIIDWHILLLFSNNEDGVMKNFYLYKKDSRTPFRIGIWDYDHSFGRDGDNELNMMEREIDWKSSILLDRLVNIPETGYNLRLRERWFELREKNIISLANFKWHVAENNKVIHHEVEKNFTRWPIDNKWYYDNNGYEQELALMIKFVEMRLEQLDNYFRSI